MPLNIKWLKETCINHVEGDAFMVWCSAERKWVNRIHKLATKYPDLVEICCSGQSSIQLVPVAFAESVQGAATYERRKPQSSGRETRCMA